MAVLGIDLGGTKLAAAAFNNDGDILIKEIVLLNRMEGQAVGELIWKIILKLSDSVSKRKLNLKAVGVSVPGISHVKEGTVWAPNINGWENYPLLDEIASALDDPEMKIAIDSDRACSILGEVWKGAAMGCKDAIFLAVGTGIGAGIITNGKVLRGADDIAGAIGWMALDKPYYLKYKEMGCFEYQASGDGLARVAIECMKEEKMYTGILSNKRADEITAHDVFSAYQGEDYLAKKVIDQAIEFWGMAIANLVSLFNPEKIILGGGIFGPGIQFKQQIIDEATRWSQPISIQKVAIESSVLQSDAALYGAAHLALKD